MNKMFFALIAALPLLAGCWGKKETPAPVAQEEMASATEQSSSDDAQEAAEEASEAHDDESDEK